MQVCLSIYVIKSVYLSIYVGMYFHFIYLTLFVSIYVTEVYLTIKLEWEF